VTGWASAGHAFSTMDEMTTSGLKAAVLEFGGAELTSGGGLLFKHLLFLRVGVADLDDMLLASRTVHCSIVELIDDFSTNVTTLEPKF